MGQGAKAHLEHMRPVTVPDLSHPAGAGTARDREVTTRKQSIQDRLGSQKGDKGGTIKVGERATHLFQDDEALVFLKAGLPFPTTAEEIKKAKASYGALDMGKLNKEFGELLCKGPIIWKDFRANPPHTKSKLWLRYCTCPDKEGHGYNGPAHRVEEARKRWQGFSKEVQEGFRCAR